MWLMKWTGLLADWEMSKPILDEPAGKFPRQPERTVCIPTSRGARSRPNHYIKGTWQYMSVALLSWAKSVEICDELEAFFYVLLYHAARYLRSNLEPITLANYLDAFFDQYSLTDDGYQCGTQKRAAIATGRLTVKAGVDLKFDEPMNHLICTLLSWFKSHHVVTEYNRRLEQEQKTEKTQAQMPAPAPPPSDGASNTKFKFSWTRAAEMDLPGQGSAKTLAPRTQGAPNDSDWDDWENVRTHRPIVELFEELLAKDWPTDDKEGDRIPAMWVRPLLLDSTGVSTTKTNSSNKRPRRGRVDAVATAPIPDPPQLIPKTPTKQMESRREE